MLDYLEGPKVAISSYLSLDSPPLPEYLRAEQDPLQRPYRKLALFVTFAAFAFNLGLAYFYHWLPDDPLHLAWHLTFYTYFAIALSVIGFVGAKKGNATCVTIFANYLFIDIILCTIPRLVAITFFPEMRNMVCSSDSIHAFLQSQDAFPASPTAGSAAAAFAPTDDAVRTELQNQCRRVVGVLQALAAILAVAVTAVQVVLALRVSAYAGMLQKQEDVSEAFIQRSRSSSAADEKQMLELGRIKGQQQQQPHAHAAVPAPTKV